MIASSSVCFGTVKTCGYFVVCVSGLERRIPALVDICIPFTPAITLTVVLHFLLVLSARIYLGEHAD